MGSFSFPCLVTVTPLSFCNYVTTFKLTSDTIFQELSHLVAETWPTCLKTMSWCLENLNSIWSLLLLGVCCVVHVQQKRMFTILFSALPPLNSSVQLLSQTYATPKLVPVVARALLRLAKPSSSSQS